MSTVIANMSMSLDGFIEDRDGDAPPHLFGWMQRGTERFTAPAADREFRTSKASAEHLQDAFNATGAVVCGRRLFDLSQGWDGRHPVDAPVFVITHEPPTDWAHPAAPFTFVTDGVASAVEQAKTIAGEKVVAVATADIARPCLKLKLLDAIAIDLVPVLLGAGKPWFAGLEEVVELEDPEITQGEGVTHLLYRVKR